MPEDLNSHSSLPTTPQRSASASSATSASEFLFYRKVGFVKLNPEVAVLIFFGMKTVTFPNNENQDQCPKES